MKMLNILLRLSLRLRLVALFRRNLSSYSNNSCFKILIPGYNTWNLDPLMGPLLQKWLYLTNLMAIFTNVKDFLLLWKIYSVYSRTDITQMK